MPTTESSLLLRRISDALDRIKPRRGRIHVSVAAEPRWEKRPTGDELHVRWLCWSIDDDGVEVVPPEFEVLHPSVTRERLMEELPSHFPDVEIVVDEDIDV